MSIEFLAQCVACNKCSVNVKHFYCPRCHSSHGSGLLEFFIVSGFFFLNPFTLNYEHLIFIRQMKIHDFGCVYVKIIIIFKYILFLLNFRKHNVHMIPFAFLCFPGFTQDESHSFAFRTSSDRQNWNTVSYC